MNIKRQIHTLFLEGKYLQLYKEYILPRFCIINVNVYLV